MHPMLEGEEGSRESWGDRHGFEVGSAIEDRIPFLPLPDLAYPTDVIAQPWNVMTGTWWGMPVVTFDVHLGSFLDSCALTTVDCDFPRLRILRHNYGGWLRSKAHLGHHGTESGEFDDTFIIQCDEPRFANDFVSQAMMAWLLARDGQQPEIALDVAGPWIMCALPLLPVERTGEVLDALATFVGHIPTVVFDLYRT